MGSAEGRDDAARRFVRTAVFSLFALVGLAMLIAWDRGQVRMKELAARNEARARAKAAQEALRIPDEDPDAPPPPPAIDPPARAGPAEARGVLRVVDDETGDPIPGARVARLEEVPATRNTQHLPVRRAAAPGEFAYEGPAGVVPFQVEAAGFVGYLRGNFAVEVPKGDGLRHEFRLERAGTLRVRFLCEGKPAAPKSARLNLSLTRRRSGITAVGLFPKDGTVVRDDLPPGAYGIEVEAGPGFRAVPEEFVEVRKAEVTEKTIELVRKDPDTPEPGSVTGTVRFHPGWGARKAKVRFEPKGASPDEDRTVEARAAPAGGAFAFDAGPLPEGEYWLEVLPQWRTLVTVPEKGAHFDLEVPEPATVRVVVLEDATGKPLRGARLTWHSPVAGLGSYTHTNETPDPRTGEFRFPVPPGFLEFAVQARGFVRVDGGGGSADGPDQERLRLESGESKELTVRLKPAGSFTLLVRCDGAPLRKDDARPSLSRANEKDGARRGSTTWWMNGGPALYRIDDLAPGEYKLEVGDEQGRFHPFPPATVRVEAGKAAAKTIFLRRVE